jgi:hypothetical protein
MHFEALLKSGEWQSLKSQPKVTMRAMAAEKRYNFFIFKPYIIVHIYTLNKSYNCAPFMSL